MPFCTQDAIDVPLFSFYDETIKKLDWIVQSIRHEQLMFTDDSLREVSRELFSKEYSEIHAATQSRQEVKRRVDLIHAKVADHYAMFNEDFTAADLISPKEMDGVMFLYSECFFEELDHGGRELMIQQRYLKNLVQYTNDLRYCWEDFFNVLKFRLPKRSGVFRAEYVHRLMQDLFEKRVCDFDGVVDKTLYRQRVEAFNYELANLADRMSLIDDKWRNAIGELIEAEDDYYAAGRHVLVDAYDDADWPSILSPRYFQKPGMLYYVKDTKYPYGYLFQLKRKNIAKKSREVDLRSPPASVIVSGISKDAVQSLKQGIFNTGRPRATPIRFTQPMVAALCMVKPGTVANWERGRTRKIPAGYSKELRCSGGTEFYNFITEYWRTREQKKDLRLFLEGKVAYLEGLTEKEAGMVQDFINSCRNGGIKP